MHYQELAFGIINSAKWPLLKHSFDSPMGHVTQVTCSLGDTLRFGPSFEV